MRYKLECEACGATCWARGEHEEDVNAAMVLDNQTLEWESEENDCSHENYKIVDQEPDDSFDDNVI